MKFSRRSFRSTLVAACLAVSAGLLPSCGGGSSSSSASAEDDQAVFRIVTQAASSLGSFGNQGSGARSVRTIRTSEHYSGPNHTLPVTITMAIQAEPIPGFSGYAVYNGNMKATINKVGYVQGDFMITTQYADAKSREGDTIDGSLTQAGNLSGAGETLRYEFKVSSASDFSVNGRGHQFLLKINAVATGRGISFCSGTGIIDSRSVYFDCK